MKVGEIPTRYLFKQSLPFQLTSGYAHPVCRCLSVCLKQYYSKAIFLVLFGKERASVSVHMRNGWLFPFVVANDVAADCKFSNCKSHEGILE